MSTRVAKEWRRVFRREAGRIWRDQALANRNGLVLNEETITETALVQISANMDSRYFRVRAHNRHEEAKSGADWEWIIYGAGRSIVFRVQAKRLFDDGTYRSLDPRGVQTSKLIAQANRWRANPAFVFYNDTAGIGASGVTGLRGGCKCQGFKGPSYWGASIAHAAHVQAVGRKQFTSLRPVMTPWHCLMCRLLNSELFKLGLGRLPPDGASRETDKISEVEPVVWQEDVDWQHGELRSQSAHLLEEYLAQRELAGVAFFELTIDGMMDVKG